MAFHEIMLDTFMFRRLLEGRVHYIVATGPTVGDLIRIDEGVLQNLDRYPTGRQLFRQVVKQEDIHDDGTSILILIPLDHPLMRQIEIAKSDDETSILWVGSHSEIPSGSTIQLVRHDKPVQVLRSFISLRATALPPKLGLLI